MDVDQVISDAEISSVQEEKEMLERAEREELDELDRRMTDLMYQTMDEVEAADDEKEVLEMELQSELQCIEAFQVAIDTFHDGAREQLQEMLDYQSELSNVSLDTLNLISTLQELREKNYFALRSDPIHTLVLEERYLTQQLAERNIHMYVPTDNDE